MKFQAEQAYEAAIKSAWRDYITAIEPTEQAYIAAIESARDAYIAAVKSAHAASAVEPALKPETPAVKNQGEKNDCHSGRKY